jgi:hypothetical protein
MAMRQAEDRDEQKVLDDVREYGWHAVGIEEDATGPPFTYSIGFRETYGHPEVLVIGVDPHVGFGILANLADRIRDGDRFEPGRDYPGILENYPVRFCEVGQEFYHDYLGYARWFYEGDTFPALQCVLPDRDHHFPWDEGFSPGLQRRQPILNAAWAHLNREP